MIKDATRPTRGALSARRPRTYTTACVLQRLAGEHAKLYICAGELPPVVASHFWIAGGTVHDRPHIAEERAASAECVQLSKIKEASPRVHLVHPQSPSTYSL
jgi:hypothetical protein